MSPKSKVTKPQAAKARKASVVKTAKNKAIEVPTPDVDETATPKKNNNNNNNKGSAPDPDPRKKPPPPAQQAGMCEGGAAKIIERLIPQLDSIIANKGDWCDGNHFAPARALLQSWLNDQTGSKKQKQQQQQQQLLNKRDAKTIFVDPILGHLDFVAANKDWCDAGRFSQARGLIQAWVEAAAGEQLCRGGALKAVNPVITELALLVANKGSWCDGNRFVPALTLLQEWVGEQTAVGRDVGGACG